MRHRTERFFSFHSDNLRRFLLSILLPIVLLFALLSSYYMKQFVDDRQAATTSLMDAVASDLNAGLSELEHISFLPYLYSDIETTMIYMRNGYFRPDAAPVDALKITELENGYTRLLTKMLHTARQHVQRISFYPLNDDSAEGYTITRSTAGLQRETVTQEKVDYLYGATQPFGLSPIFLCDPQSTTGAYSMVRIIYDMDAKHALGVFQIDAQISSLSSFLDSFPVSEHSALILLDSMGNIVYANGTADAMLIHAAQNGVRSKWVGMHRYLLDRRTIGSGSLIHICAVRDSYASFSGSVAIILGVIVLSYGIAFLLYRRQSADTANAIDAIMEAIRQLQDGNYNYSCHVSSEDYIPIAHALNNTGQKLQELIQAEASARAGQSRAEYFALQSQINPHFLNNTLNGFIALNRMGERKQLENSILQLAQLFRYICHSGETNVEQEYAFASHYLELQKLRFDDRISYEILVEEGAGEIAIPRLIIQPLVENAVVHGMEGSDEPICITLRAYLHDSKLILEVTDTGIGFDVATLESTPRVGLKNVLLRLKLFNADMYHEIISAPGCGTTVRFLIPLEHGGTQL